MGRRGPAPKPTALKLLQGNPGKRPLNTREPQPNDATPRCPGWLDEEAKIAWRRIVPELKRMGLLTSIDGDALANYCDTWSRWKRSVLFLQKNGDFYSIKDEEGKAKYVQQWPQVAIARNLLAVLNRYQQEFGLTPASRSRLVLPEQGSPTGIAEFLGFNAASA
jgi:P27 family predicted phage terminase small subunit